MRRTGFHRLPVADRMMVRIGGFIVGIGLSIPYAR